MPLSAMNTGAVARLVAAEGFVRMRYHTPLLISAATAFMVLAAPVVQAGQALNVETDQSQLVILPATPGSVVIGNPTIADATVEGNKMFIHGRAFGTTNIMVMDTDGNQIAAFDVSTNHITSNTVALYRGTERRSLNCAPFCEYELQIGDAFTHSVEVAAQTKTKIELATGTDTAKSEAPPAPQ